MASTVSKTWLTRALVAFVALALLVAFIMVVRGFLTKSGEKKKGVQQVSILKQPPPPPPKPPEKPPEPQKVKEEVKIDEPVQKPDEAKQADDKPAADKPLGVDAEAGAGSDGFGLIGNKGGRELTTTGGGSGAYYTGLLQRQFYEALLKNRKMLKEEFRVVVKIWLGDDGKVQRTDVITGSGNKQVDDLIVATLADLPAMKEVPPPSMRPVQLRLSNRS